MHKAAVLLEMDDSRSTAFLPSKCMQRQRCATGGVGGGQERHGCASAAGCRIQLRLHKSCYTDDSAAFLELEDWYNRRPLHASVDALIDA